MDMERFRQPREGGTRRLPHAGDRHLARLGVVERVLPPAGDRIAERCERHPLDPEWAAVLDAQAAEIELYRRFGASYGYVVYLLRRLG
jgi:hypothetical protein